MRTFIPNQFFGLGDIIWCQTLVKELAQGNPILWPVLPHFVEGLNRAYPDITFVDYKSLPLDYENRNQYHTTIDGIGEAIVLPLRWADTLLKVPYTQCMSSKYAMYGMDWQRWKEHAMWKRNEQQEDYLYWALKPPVSDNYNLVNCIFGSDSQLQVPIEVPNKLRDIRMQTYQGVSLFDWAKLLEQATEIHTVSTSIIYILELLDLQAPGVHLYPRRPHEHDFRNIDYILQKHKYIRHG